MDLGIKCGQANGDEVSYTCNRAQFDAPCSDRLQAQFELNCRPLPGAGKICQAGWCWESGECQWIDDPLVRAPGFSRSTSSRLVCICQMDRLHMLANASDVPSGLPGSSAMPTFTAPRPPICQSAVILICCSGLFYPLCDCQRILMGQLTPGCGLEISAGREEMSRQLAIRWVMWRVSVS